MLRARFCEKPEPSSSIGEAHGAIDARRIVDETLLVQDAGAALAQVTLAAGRIVQLLREDVDGDGVDREIAAQQVVFQAARRDRRKRARLAISLFSCGS